MKTIWWWVIGAVVVAGVAYVGLQQQKPQGEAGAVKIGAILPLTGSNAAHGEFARRGIELAREHLGAQAPHVIYEDNQFDPKLAVSAYQKLHNIDHVQALLILGSPSGMSLSPLVNKDHIPLLGIVAAPPYSSPDDFTYRIVGSSVIEARELTKLVIDTFHPRKIGLLVMNNDYGKGTATAIKKEFATQAKDVSITETAFNPDETDMRSQVQQLKAANPDVVVIAALGKETGIFVKQAATLGLRARFVCAQACENPDLITAGGIAAEGVLMTVPDETADATFTNAYMAKYKEAPNFVSMRMYRATLLFSKVFGQCKTVIGDALQSCLQEKLYASQDQSLFVFDKNGDIDDHFVLRVVHNGAFIPLQQ